ncbi:MAG: hypothetical protein ACE5H9_19250 [Anaerolineae bacterium]
MAKDEELEETGRGQEEKAATSGQGWRVGSWSPWFITGLSVSIMLLCAAGLLVLLLASVAVNAYLAWQLSDLEITISRRSAPATAVVFAPPTASPTASPTATATDTPEPTSTFTPIPTDTATPAPTATATPAPTNDPPPPASPAAIASATPDPTGPVAIATESSRPGEPAEVATDFPAPIDSTNTYALIPLQGERDDRPPDEHGDLNLKLREPQPIDAERSLVDIGGFADPNAPKLSDIFEPDILEVYAVHQWDWNCNCLGDLESDPTVVSLQTTPGQPVFIPSSQQDIYQGKYYAVVLYASEDSLVFTYAREGTVAHGYTIHYVGLHTDPNLLALYRQSPRDELPGLTLDTPVGIATGELMVAVRDGGRFMDTRSRKDWWD